MSVSKSSSAPLHSVQKAYSSRAAINRGRNFLGDKTEIAPTDMIGHGALFEGKNAKRLQGQ